MRFYIVLIIFIISFNLNSSETYKIKIMGTFEGETIKLPNGGNFNIFKGNAAFSDSDGNYGDAIGRGIRETDINNQITNIYAVLIFESSNGSKMMVRPARTESDINAGAGSFKILFATGAFKKYIGFNCKYAITTTKNGSFIQENICK
jgi:hypothetical protein